MSDGSDKRILLGRIGAAHGIRGEVVVASFTENPADVAAYGPLTDGPGKRTFVLKSARPTAKGGVVVRIEGIADRTAAEALRGTELWVERDRLPPTTDGEYYHADLIGLAAVAPDGSAVGTVVAVENFGAGDLVEIRLVGSHRTELVPFADAFVPTVDLAGRRLVVIMPAEAPDTEEGEGEKGGAGPKA